MTTKIMWLINVVMGILFDRNKFTNVYVAVHYLGYVARDHSPCLR